MCRFFIAISVMFLGLQGLCVAAGESRAQQAYPTKPIQFVVTTAAGGANDLVARTVGNRLSELLHQPIVIENQPAADALKMEKPPYEFEPVFLRLQERDAQMILVLSSFEQLYLLARQL